MPVFRLTDRIIFPPADLAEDNGLLAVGGDLSPRRLIAGYQRGIFPWYSESDPILWWFTSPRLVLFPEELKISGRLRRYLKNSGFSCSRDAAFAEVITACAETRQETWITTDMVSAYIKLHQLGYAHSVECWRDKELVGGVYGVALDQVFFGESMFSTLSNSSKYALVHLVTFLRQHGYRLIDCQMTTPHLISLGAREVSGKEFQHLLKTLINSTTPDGAWSHGTSH